MPESPWPRGLLLVRHGESAGNVARLRAEAAGTATVDITERDMDVPLSPLGREQASALGRWLGRLPAGERPGVVYSSPYLRACDTARLVLEGAGPDAGDVAFTTDERLREREFGILDRLTRAGIEERHPDQAHFRAHLGKFYHRPPGGESWADVALRVRTVIDSLTRDCCGERVLVVTHQVVVLLFRYALEQLSEQQILEVDRSTELANCSVTSYELAPGPRGRELLALERFNYVVPLEVAGAEVTAEPDVPVARP